MQLGSPSGLAGMVFFGLPLLYFYEEGCWSLVFGGWACYISTLGFDFGGWRFYKGKSHGAMRGDEMLVCF